MCDIFTKADAKKLLNKKHIVFFGDSNIRAIYKDVIWLLKTNKLIDNHALKKKLESTFAGDSLKKGRVLNRGRDYEEVRVFKSEGVHAEFHFITRCYTKEIRELVVGWKLKKNTAPDVIVINSCLWDVTRWGPNGVPEYKDNLVKLMKLFKSCLPQKTLVIWTTVPPLSNRVRGGLLIRQVEFMQHTLRFEVMEANLFARQVVVPHGFDVLDIHYYLRMQILGRAKDGIHWLPVPMRHMTNLLLTHICLSWNCPLPGNFHGQSLERFKQLAIEEKAEAVVLPPLPAAVSKLKGLPKAGMSPFRKTKGASRVAASPLRKAIREKLGKNKPLTSAFDNKENDTLNDSVSFDTSTVSLCSAPGDTSIISSIDLDITPFPDKNAFLQLQVCASVSNKNGNERQVQMLGPAPLEFPSSSSTISRLPEWHKGHPSYVRDNSSGPMRQQQSRQWSRRNRRPAPYNFY